MTNENMQKKFEQQLDIWTTGNRGTQDITSIYQFVLQILSSSLINFMSTTNMGIPKELALKQNKEGKKVKKEKKRQREDEEAVVEDKGKPETKKKKLSKEERKALKAEKKAEKKAALEKVPKVDEHGEYFFICLLQRVLTSKFISRSH